ncbi:MAG: entericidin A/B family lipoprotein [Burkholderiales bacterium]
MYRHIAPLLIAFAVAGRNTVEGMGKDISKGGDAVQVPRRV